VHPTFLTVLAVVTARANGRASGATARVRVRVECAHRRVCMCACVRACLSFFRNRRRVGGAKLEDAEEGRRPVINGTRETAFLESLLVLLFAAQHRSRAEHVRKSHPHFRDANEGTGALTPNRERERKSRRKPQ